MPVSPDPSLGKYLGLGLNIAIGVGIGYFVGDWLDRKYGWSPWGMLVSVLLGMSGGMYLLIKEGIAANKD